MDRKEKLKGRSEAKEESCGSRASDHTVDVKQGTTKSLNTQGKKWKARQEKGGRSRVHPNSSGRVGVGVGPFLLLRLFCSSAYF